MARNNLFFLIIVNVKYKVTVKTKWLQICEGGSTPTTTATIFQVFDQRDKIVSAEVEWKLIVLLQRQGKDCISMKWAIDLNDESLALRWACNAALFL